jgi:hypothetical protein
MTCWSIRPRLWFLAMKRVGLRCLADGSSSGLLWEMLYWAARTHSCNCMCLWLLSSVAFFSQFCALLFSISSSIHHHHRHRRQGCQRRQRRHQELMPSRDHGHLQNHRLTVWRGRHAVALGFDASFRGYTCSVMTASLFRGIALADARRTESIHQRPATTA